MLCEWNTTHDGFIDPFKKQEGDCQNQATITIGRHPWAFVCESCVKSKKLKTFMKRSMRQGATVASEMQDKCDTAGFQKVIDRAPYARAEPEHVPKGEASKVIRRKRVEH
jgi:hypothetical protein